MSFTYVASPYSHPDFNVVQERFERTKEFVADCLINNVFVYSPIVHCHDLALTWDLPKDFDYWRAYNQAVLSKASELVVLTLDGWKDSQGVQSEIEFAHQCGIKVKYE